MERKIRIKILHIAFACSALLFSGCENLEDQLWKTTSEGNQLYKEAEYDEALKKYTNAQLEAPESKILHFNIGDVYYRLQKHDQAIESWQKAVAADSHQQRADAWYNIGNAHYQKKAWIEAIDSYKRALDIVPDHEDAKFNLELVRRRLKSGPSEEALRYKKEIEKLVKEKKYGEAWNVTAEALQKDETFQKLGDMIMRVYELAGIFDPESVQNQQLKIQPPGGAPGGQTGPGPGPRINPMPPPKQTPIPMKTPLPRPKGVKI